MKVIVTNNFWKSAKSKYPKSETTPYNPWAVCVPPETFITIEDGSSKCIRDIRIGDRVITHKGKSRIVKNIMKRHIHEDIYKISISGIPDPLYVTKEHPVFALNSIKKFSGYAYDKNRLKTGKKWYKYRYGDKPEFVEASKLNTNFAVHSPSIKFDQEEISDFDEKDAFVLGVYCAEGSIGGTKKPKTEWRCGNKYNVLMNKKESDIGYYVMFTLHKDKDKFILDFLRKYTKSKFGEKYFTVYGPYKNNPNCISCKINSRKFANFCEKHVGMGSKNKKLSSLLMGSSSYIIQNFLIGYFMGDGFFDISDIQIENNRYSSFSNKHFGKMTATSASKDLIHQLFWLCEKIGLASTLYRNKQNGGPNKRNEFHRDYGLALNTTELSKLTPIINKLNIFERFVSIKSSNRKGQRFLMAACSYGKIRKIEKVPYNGYVYNLEVDEDNSYIANLCSVHNCHESVGSDKDDPAFERCVQHLKEQNRKKNKSKKSKKSEANKEEIDIVKKESQIEETKPALRNKIIDRRQLNVSVPPEERFQEQLDKELSGKSEEERESYYSDKWLELLRRHKEEPSYAQSKTVVIEAKKKEKWIQEAVPESHEGDFGEWCKRHGFEQGTCQSCIDKAISEGGHAARMANFAINVSKGKYHHPQKDKD